MGLVSHQRAIQQLCAVSARAPNQAELSRTLTCL
jgi:hypothetical protein